MKTVRPLLCLATLLGAFTLGGCIYAGDPGPGPGHDGGPDAHHRDDGRNGRDDHRAPPQRDNDRRDNDHRDNTYRNDDHRSPPPTTNDHRNPPPQPNDRHNNDPRR